MGNIIFYRIYANNGYRIIHKAKPIKIKGYEFLDLFLWQWDKTHMVYTNLCGARIGMGSSRREAIRAAVEQLESNTTRNIKRKVLQLIKQNGHNDRYSGWKGFNRLLHNGIRKLKEQRA